MNRKSWLKSAALGAAVVLGGCSSDRARTGTALVDPGASAVVDGARVAGRLVRHVRLFGAGETVAAESSSVQEFGATMLRGAARAAPHGPLVAVARGRRFERPVTITDSLGHRHRIEFDNGDGDAPPRGARASIDGRPLAIVELEWRRVAVGFVLARKTTTLLRADGTPGLREDVTMEGGDVASAGAIRRGAGAFAHGLAAAMLPVPVAAEDAWPCFAEGIWYAFASMGVAVAWEALTRMPYEPKTWVIMGGALKIWEGAFGDYIGCLLGV